MEGRKPYKQRRRKWTDKDEEFFVDLWEEKISEFRGKCKNKPIYKEMSLKFAKRGVDFSPDEIKTKLSNLTGKYRKENKAIGIGEPPSEWPLYARIHAILRENIHNPDAIIEDSIPRTDKGPSCSRINAEASSPLTVRMPSPSAASTSDVSLSTISASSSESSASTPILRARKRKRPDTDKLVSQRKTTDEIIRDDEVVRLLHLWGLSDLKAKFKANYIVPQALEFLTEEDIVDLIPKIGQRAIFRGRLLQWRQENALAPPKALTSYKTEKVPKPEADSEVIKKVKEPSPPPPVKVQPKVHAIVTKPLQKPKPQDEVAPKPSIQSKVQKFYISPAALKADSPIRLLSPSPPLLPPHITAPDLTPFVTSIIRVETNCDKKSNTQVSETNPPNKVNRTRILQKIKINERPPTPASDSSPRSITKVNEPKPSIEENNAHQYEEEQPDARHLYPIIKLETESADTSWNEFDSEPEMTVEPESVQPQVITKREPEEAVADSTDVQHEAMDALESEFYNENDNPLLKLEQMSPKNIRPKRRRARPPRKFDIRNILMNTPMGRHVLQFYEKNDRLDSRRRRMLIDAIIQDCWTSNRHISPNNCIAIAMEIVRVLPNENMSDYFQAQTGKNPRSPLYNKYRNMRRRFFIGKNGLPPPICASTRTPNSLTHATDDVQVDDVYIIS